MDKDARKELGYNNREWGQKAEALTAEYFLKEGYTIRERNWHAGRLEVDLILEKDRTLIFVEVKARSSHGEDPALAVDRKKRQRTIRAADTYLRMQQVRYEYRFDIVTFTGTEEDYVFAHYEDAYLPEVNSSKL